MKNFTPTLLVAFFGIAMTVRLGYFGHEYYRDMFTAKAQEKLEKKEEEKAIKPDETVKKSVDNTPLKTVTDRILQQDVKNNKNKDIADFASKSASKSEIINPEKVCITGPILKETLKKLAYLDKREAEIMEQERLLETSDRRIREQVAKLKLIKEEIVESAKLADSTINRESKRVISIYEKMKPKDAANIFNEMLPDVAAELLRTMKEDQSSQILSKMNPKNAYDVTLSLAGGIKSTKEKYNMLKNSETSQ